MLWRHPTGSRWTGVAGQNKCVYVNYGGKIRLFKLGPLMSTPIEHFHEYKLSKNEFDSLNDLEQVAISVSTFATSELITFMRLYSFAGHDEINVPTIDTINTIQKHIIMRIWSAKLFEFHKFLGDLRKRSENNCDSVYKVADAQMKGFNKLKKMRAFGFVRSLRNSSINHYSVKDALESIGYLSENADLSLFIHDLEGNSVSPLGEEVMFVAPLNRYGKLPDGSVDRSIYNDWHKWNIEALTWVKVCHLEIWKEIVFRHFPNKYVRKKSYWLRSEMVGELGEVKTPLFARAFEYYKKKGH